MTGILITSMFFLLVLAFFAPKIEKKIGLGLKKQGISVQWRLDSERVVEIISNARLGYLQSFGQKIKEDSLIIVWADNFLDDDILYETVKFNIKNGIKYLYVLDRNFTDKFINLLRKLKHDAVSESTIEVCINVLFIKEDASLNNHVLLCAEDLNESFYSAMTYEKVPFAWLEQSELRSREFTKRVKNLVASIAMHQYLKNQKISDDSRVENEGSSLYDLTRLFFDDDQIMDYSSLGEKLISQKEKSIALDFNLKDLVSTSKLPRNTLSLVSNFKDKKVVGIKWRN